MTRPTQVSVRTESLLHFALQILARIILGSGWHTAVPTEYTLRVTGSVARDSNVTLGNDLNVRFTVTLSSEQ